MLPPVLSQSEIIAVNQSSNISEIGAPSTISRIDSKTGMILLPLGFERGVEQGNVFYSVERPAESCPNKSTKLPRWFFACLHTPTFWDT